MTSPPWSGSSRRCRCHWPDPARCSPWASCSPECWTPGTSAGFPLCREPERSGFCSSLGISGCCRRLGWSSAWVIEGATWSFSRGRGSFPGGIPYRRSAWIWSWASGGTGCSRGRWRWCRSSGESARRAFWWLWGSLTPLVFWIGFRSTLFWSSTRRYWQ